MILTQVIFKFKFLKHFYYKILNGSTIKQHNVI